MIYVDESTKPKFCQVRSVLYAHRNKVDEELVQLQEVTIEPVEWADWSPSIVPVLKRNKVSICICGDFCLTASKPVSNLYKYPGTYPK